MRILKQATALLSIILFLFCFANVALGFNPQPEPPGTLANPQQQENPTTMEPLDRPAPLGLQQQIAPGAEKMDDEEDPPIQTKGDKLQRLPGARKAIDPVDDGKKLLPSTETLQQ